MGKDKKKDAKPVKTSRGPGRHSGKRKLGAGKPRGLPATWWAERDVQAMFRARLDPAVRKAILEGSVIDRAEIAAKKAERVRFVA